MMMEDLILNLRSYGLTLIKRGNGYSLVEIDSGEVYEAMSTYHIHILLNTWNYYHNNFSK